MFFLSNAFHEKVLGLFNNRIDDIGGTETGLALAKHD
jgi:hypothetical protein